MSHQPHRRGPGRRHLKPRLAQAISQDQTQQVDRALISRACRKHASRVRSLKRLRPPKPLNNPIPVAILQE